MKREYHEKHRIIDTGGNPNTLTIFFSQCHIRPMAPTRSHSEGIPRVYTGPEISDKTERESIREIKMRQNQPYREPVLIFYHV